MPGNFRDCIREAVQAKKISQKRADDLRDQIDRYVQAGNPTADEAVAATRGMEALDALEADALRRKANAVRQARTDRWNAAEAAMHPKGIVYGAWSKLARDITGLARWGNADSAIHIEQQRLRGLVADAISQLRASGIVGQRQDFQLAEQVALELRGKDTGSANAKGMAAAFARAFDDARETFNQLGGSIKSRGDWGTPQPHDEEAVAAVGMDEWRDFIRPLLDSTKMFGADGFPLKAGDLDDLLEGSFESITQAGIIQPKRRGAAANRHLDHRVLVFKDADSWLAYNRRFGKADIFGGFMSHLDGMAKEIGSMRVLGPNPQAGVSALQEAMARGGASAAQVQRLGGLAETVRGLGGPVGTVAQMAEAVRQLNVSTKLGSAALSSLTDEATIARTALWNGLRPVQIIREELAQMTSEERRIFAIRAGLGWDSWTRNGIATNRFADEAIGKGWSAIPTKLAEATMRASGLNVVTDARKAAFGMEFLGALGDFADRSLAEIGQANPRLEKALRGYGFDEGDWDALRSAGVVDFQGARYIHPQQFLDNVSGLTGRMPLAAVRRVSDNLMRMVHTETRFAVPEPGALERFYVTGGTKRGTREGELARSLLQFRTFPVTLMTTHLARGLYQQGAKGKAAYLVPFLLMGTGAAALVLQARAITQGRDPLDMTDPAFWGAALAQSGGLGLLGDFAYQGITGSSRFGNSFAMSMAGPTVTMIDDAAKVVFPAMRGDLSPRSAVDFATKHLIPGSSLWYARLFIDREFKDQLLRAADPVAANRSFAAREKFYNEQGSRFWWKPGQSLPEFLR